MFWAYLDEMNMSELVVSASSMNPNVHRSLSRDVLIAIIKNEYPGTLPTRHIDRWRETIFRFVDAHWKQCSPLLTCPMKSREPFACFRCLDAQVAECVLTNHTILQQGINLTKKKMERK